MEQLEPVEYKCEGQVFHQPKWKLRLLDDKEWTVFYFDNPIALSRFWIELGQAPKFLAIDTERDIIFNPSYSAPCARVRVISLCSHNVCFVISTAMSTDLKDDQNRYILHQNLVKLFEGEKTIKIGFGLEEDWNYIVKSFSAQNKDGSIRDIEPKGSLDLRSLCLALGEKRGLDKLVEEKLEIQLDKSLQKSKDWKQVPLPEEFIHYAAMDAIATHLLAEKIQF